MANPFPGPAVATSTPLGVGEGMNFDTASSRTGYVYEWNFSAQRQLTPSMMFEASYFGSRGLKLASQIIDNTATSPGTDPYQDRQIWPQFPPYIDNNYHEMNSEYNGLSLKLDKRASHNLTLLVDFTWQKTLDNVDSTRDEATLIGAEFDGNPTRFNIGSFWGDAGFDIEKVFNASYIYQIPFTTQNKLANAVLAHWELSGNIMADSGTPYFVFIDGDNENIGYAGRYDEFPNLIGNPNAISHRTATEWFNTAAYQMGPFGTAGDAGKHGLFSDPEINWDSAFMKRWPFGESRAVEFRAEFFDFLNASTFLPPYSAVNDPNFGVISGTRQGGRTIQFALKLHF
jgi:hypothetical protein